VKEEVFYESRQKSAEKEYRVREESYGSEEKEFHMLSALNHLKLKKKEVGNQQIRKSRRKRKGRMN